MVVIIGTVVYKTATLVIGFGLAYLGFRLLLSGIFEGGGDLDASFADNTLILKKASPGIFFALFGTIILSISIWKGLEFEQTATSSQSQVIVESVEDEMAIIVIKDLIAGSQNIKSLSDFEIQIVGELLQKLEANKVNQNKGNVSSRGIASED